MFQSRMLSLIFSLALLYGAGGRAPLRSDAGLSARPSLEPQEERAGDRIRPPGALNCSRNDLTSFTGRVLSYSRTAGRLSIRLRTDEQTTERFTLRYGPKGNPARWFLLRAEPFQAADWKSIESRPRRLRPGMRATVWVCTTSAEPIIDWQPPEP